MPVPSVPNTRLRCRNPSTGPRETPPLPPTQVRSAMEGYRFNGKKGQFHVLAAPNAVPALFEAFVLAFGALLKGFLVAAVLDHNGAPVRHHARPVAALGRDWVWPDGRRDDVDADPDVGDVLLDDIELPPPPPAAAGPGLPWAEYKFCLEFKDPFSRRPRNLALRLLNRDPHNPLIAACTPLTASTEEDAVDMMVSEHCREWGAFTLGRSALPMLLNHRYHSLSDEPEVVKTIAKHVPLKRVVDAQYRRDILSIWKRNFPCDPAVLPSQFSARAPYMMGWKQWMDTYITPQPQHMPPDSLVSTTRRQLVLLGPPAINMTGWARSHGPHVYMCGRLDLPRLHLCLTNGGAQYIVLHNIPWSQLLAEDKHGHSVLTNATFTWYRGNQLETTTQRLPVIILNDHLPHPDDPRWEPRGWEYWKSILHITDLTKHSHIPLLVLQRAAEAALVDKEIARAPQAACNYSGGKDEDAKTEKVAGYTTTSTASDVSKSRDDTTAAAMVDIVQMTTTTRKRTRSQSRGPESVMAQIAELASEQQREQRGRPAEPLQLDLNLTRRIPYGPDSFFYPDAIPVAHRTRLLHVVAAIDYVQMKYRGRDLARQKNFQSDNIAGSYGFYEYTGSVPDVWHLGEWSPEMLQLRDALRAQINELINSLVANQYMDGTASIDHHSDKTPDIQRGTSIWTVSLGATRLFELRTLDGSETITVPLTDGSLFQIGPLTNASYTHSIPTMDAEVGPRYGLTFRTLASRWLHDEEVALRQPAHYGEPWLVQRKASRMDNDGHVVLRQQDNYPSRRVVHLEPFMPEDPSRIQEQDIVRLRQMLPTLGQVKALPTGAVQQENRKKRKMPR